MSLRKQLAALALMSVLALGLLAAACAPEPTPTPRPTATPAPTPTPRPLELTVYSGRAESLVAPIIKQFEADTGIKTSVRYADSAALAATILEEGQRSPADVFFAQDAGALGALAKAGRLTKLPTEVLTRVDSRFRAAGGEWVGLSGRARVVAYNSQKLKESDLPDSVYGFTDPKWKGRIGWPPTNASFQAFVTALRVLDGEDKAKAWLQGIQANAPKVYRNNTAAILAVASGEVEVAFINHYYLYTQIKEQGQGFPAKNYYTRTADAGAMINIAGAGILNTAKNQAAALKFVDYMLSNSSQQYFALGTDEYPLVPGVPQNPLLPQLSTLKTPKMDLNNIDDLNGTLKLLQSLGIL